MGVELGHVVHELIVQSCIALHSEPHAPQFERSDVMSVHGLLAHTTLGGMRQDPPSSVYVTRYVRHPTTIEARSASRQRTELTTARLAAFSASVGPAQSRPLATRPPCVRGFPRGSRWHASREGGDMQSTIILVLVMLVCLALGCSDSPPPDPQAGQALVARYQCAGCHGADLSGSDWPNPGTFAYASNLTPDPDSGLGGWTDDQIAAAIGDGIDDTGAPLCSVMPRFLLSAAQVAGLVAYLRSVPAVVHDVPASDCTAMPGSDIDDAAADDTGVIIVN